jgi:uncharacterized protein with FMN-binding domain
MKKALLGLAVLGIYGIYSLGIRHQQPILPTPALLSSGNKAKSSQHSGQGTKPPAQSNTAAQYKDGTYTGSVADAYYGNVQVSVTVSGGQITDVKFLQYPNSHSTSVFINQQAMPYLKEETLKAQNANVQLISGATFTSQAFVQSLQSALQKA